MPGSASRVRAATPAASEPAVQPDSRARSTPCDEAGSSRAPASPATNQPGPALLGHSRQLTSADRAGPSGTRPANSGGGPPRSRPCSGTKSSRIHWYRPRLTRAAHVQPVWSAVISGATSRRGQDPVT